jgi:hypothetical protein
MTGSTNHSKLGTFVGVYLPTFLTILDLLAAVLVLTAIYTVFRLSHRSLNMLFESAGMHIGLVELLGEVWTMPYLPATWSMGGNSS